MLIVALAIAFEMLKKIGKLGLAKTPCSLGERSHATSNKDDSN